jgi:hypothetical protein
MTPPRDDLALRKDLLLAQSSLYRAKLRHEVGLMRSHAISKGSAFGLLTLAGGLGIGSWVAKAGRVLLFLRLARNVVKLFRR